MPTEKEYMLKKDDAETTYQKKLTAGSNITIDPVTNTISSTGGNTVSSTEAYQYGDILNTLTIDGVNHYVKTPSLIAGPNVNITRNQETGALTISATGGGSSNVIPNPEGIPADVLETIGIGNIIYRIASIVELTEDEYEDLPSSKNTDDVMYLLLENEDIFNGGSTISLVDAVGITTEETSVNGGKGFVDAYEHSDGYEGFNIALQNLTVGNTYKLEFDFQFTDAQFIGTTDYRCAYLISQSAKTDYNNYTSWTENLARDLLNHHHSVSFTATATTMHISFNLSGCSDNTDNYFIIDNMMCLDVAKTYKIMYNGNQYGGGSNTNITSGIINPSEGEENDVYYKYSYTTERLEDEITLPTFESDVSTHVNITDFNKYLNVKFMYHDIYSSMNTKILSIADLPETNNPDWGQGGDVYTFNSSHYVVCGKDSTGLWIKEDGDLLKKIYCQYDLYDYTVIDEYVKIEDAWVKVNSISINPSGQTIGKLTSFSYDDEIYDTKEVKTGTTNPSNGYADDVYYKYEYTVDILEDEITLPTIPASTSTHVDIPNFNKYTNIKFIYHDIYGADTTTILSASSIPETNNPTVDNVFDWNYAYYIACSKDSTGLWIKQGRDLLQKIYCQYDVYNYTVTDHYVKLNDTWVKIDTGGGGASAISDLTDVNLIDLSDGQILKYNSTSQEWENADETEGGSSAEEKTYIEYTALTPEEQMDGTIYFVPDNPSSGSSSYTENVLYTSQTTSFTNITIDWDWEDYDEYIFRVSDVLLSSEAGMSSILSLTQIQEIIVSEVQQYFNGIDDAQCNYYFTNNELVARSNSNGLVIQEIVGIRFGDIPERETIANILFDTPTTTTAWADPVSVEFDTSLYDLITIDVSTYDSQEGEYHNYLTFELPEAELNKTYSFRLMYLGNEGAYIRKTSTGISMLTTTGYKLTYNRVIGYKFGGGGGGTEVEANPIDPATNTLNTIGINGTVYDIAGNGSSGYDVNDYYLQNGQISDGGNRQFLTAYYDKPLITGKNYTINFKNSVDGTIVGTAVFKYTSDFTTNIAGGGSIGTITMIITSTSITSNNYSGGWQNIYVDVYREISSADFYHPVIYSSEEREIGVWTDNKPLYQKTLTIPLSNVSDWTLVDDTISYDKLIQAVGTFWEDSENGDQIGHSSARNETPRLAVKTDHKLYYFAADILSGRTFKYDVTIQYTKTTDTAGSGTYNTLRVPTVHYSTDEQVIGTWIDGSTLYEKTISMSSVLELSQYTWTNTSQSLNTSKIVSCKCIGEDGTYWDGISCKCNNGTIELMNYRANSVYIKYFTVQYTKTS